MKRLPTGPVLAALCGVLGIVLIACAPDGALPGPEVKAVDPAELQEGQRTSVTISGANFFARAQRRLGERVTVDDTWVVRIGEVPLEAVVRDSDAELSALVPGTLPPGTWAVTVEGPTGTAALEDAFTVLPLMPAGCDAGCGSGGDAGADGGSPDAGDCDGGCPFPFVPSNFDPSTITPPTQSSNLAGCAMGFNSTDDTWVNACNGARFTVSNITLPNGAEARLLATRDLDLPANGILGFYGVRPVIVAVYGDATIDGMLLANSSRELLARSGPGADPAICATGGAGGDAASTRGGGGGGGFGTAGGTGGAGGGGNPGGPAGPAATSTSPEPLRGGCPGGASGGGAQGGSGGGAFQLTVAGTLTVRGAVSASALGGEGGTSTSSGGGGGGSGGMLLLEADDLVVHPSAMLTATGGGGGGGALGIQDGLFGAEGRSDGGMPAAGGASGGSGAGAGGQGAVATATGTGGSTGSSGGGGGGGGGMGVIFLRGGTGTCMVAPTALSSPPSVKLNCP